MFLSLLSFWKKGNQIPIWEYANFDVNAQIFLIT